MKKLVLLTIAILMAGSLTAGATVVTGFVPASDRIPIPTDNYFGSGPITWDGEYTWSSTNSFNDLGSAFGYTGSYGFGANGSWTGALGPMIGVNDSTDDWGVTDTTTIAFTNPVFEVGDFFNYVPGGSTPTTIAVYDSSMNLIESYNLNFLTGGSNDSGEWLGFSESTPISYFTMTDNYIAMTATPEPGSFLLLGSGFLSLVGIARRKLSR